MKKKKVPTKWVQFNGEFDCVIKRTGGKYDFYGCKYFNRPMRESECEEEQVQMRNIQGIEVARIGFVSTGGFDFRDERLMLVDGKDLYRDFEAEAIC